jgi:alkanesulfonate monooxygenase SsuD/methylene tetrahydromethanopterin reductase-like flavin-dependent oxidoreductase (luciferase family)
VALPGGSLFDDVANRYADARSGYADEIVEWMLATAGLTRGGWPTEKVREQYVIGTPEEVLARLQIALGEGVDHLICNLGAAGSLWSAAMLELFAREVLPGLH